MRRVATLVLTALLCGAGPGHRALAQDAPAPDAAFVPSLPDSLAGAPGTWDLARDGGTRRCVLTLGAERIDAGRRLSFPAGCRKALPILNGIAGWLFADGAIRLVDKDVRPVLLFARRPDQRSLVAPTDRGETYSLVPLQIAAMQPPPAAPATAPSAGTTAAGGDSAPPRDNSLPSGERPAPGTYALDRYREQDVCRLELMEGDQARAPVRIQDGCRDGGVAVFDPVAWRYASGRLTLTAKRGHTVDLVPTGEGRWRRDPDIGTTFVLRRVEP
jgi:hypothetical protein